MLALDTLGEYLMVLRPSAILNLVRIIETFAGRRDKSDRNVLDFLVNDVSSKRKEFSPLGANSCLLE